MKWLDLLDPPLPGRIVTQLGAFFAGAGLCLSFMLSDPRHPHIWVLLAILTGLRATSGLRLRFFAWPARGVLLLFNALFVYEAIAFGLLLGWVTPWWVRLVTPILLVLFLLRRAPLALALGPWILMCLLGWRHQDNSLRCEDLERIQRQKGVSILIPTATECREDLVIGRYPRRVWEAPEGGRFVVTTSNVQFSHSGLSRPSPFTGSICEVGTSVRCLGEGTAHAIRETADCLYIAAYQQRSHERGVVYALAKDDLRILGERHFRGDSVEMYLDAAADTLGVLFDQANELVQLRASDLAPLGTLPLRFIPDDTKYDHGEGVFCFGAGPLFPDGGRGFGSIAFRGAPFFHHLLAPTSSYPSSWASLTWGCDWDPSSRRAFVASANLGWLGVIDYDSGRYLSRRFVGLGVRAVTWDPQRRVVYLGDFLRGEVVALDPESGRETGRWFAGRFVRQIVIARDGKALLVTGNAGVVRIEL